ncbi:MAG: hypothetical protein ACKO5K_03930, partial [Armatimonadota bacterium]
RLGLDPRILGLPTAGVVFSNGRSWRHRDDFVPLTGVEAVRRIAQASPNERVRWEVVVQGSVPLRPWLRAVVVDGGRLQDASEWFSRLDGAACLTGAVAVVTLGAEYGFAP